MSQMFRASDVVGVESRHSSSMLHRRVRHGADAFDISMISQECRVEESVQMEIEQRSPEDRRLMKQGRISRANSWSLANAPVPNPLGRWAESSFFSNPRPSWVHNAGRMKN